MEAWLDELNLLHRLNDDATAEERALFIDRAQRAAEAVERSFQELRAGGRLKELSARYKADRLAAVEKGRKVKPWGSYLHSEKIKTIRAMARTQRARARRGIAP